MTQNINKVVQKYISRRAEIKKCLLGDLVNIRALARKIMKEQNLHGSTDAAVSAIRRYCDDDEISKEKTKFHNIFKDVELISKTKIVLIMAKRNNTVRSGIEKLYSEIASKRDCTLCVNEDSENVEIITNERYRESLEKTIPADEIVGIKDNLAMIIIKYKADVSRIPGVAAAITGELGMNGVNIDVFITFYEQKEIIVVNENDLEKCLSVLMKMSRECQKGGDN
jgi:hypothetical protein